jgi:hypothetical protein
VQTWYRQARSGQRRAASLEQRLRGIEFRLVDDRRRDDLGFGLALARLPELRIKAMAADLRRSRQHLVDGTDAPASAIAGADTGGGR